MKIGLVTLLMLFSSWISNAQGLPDITQTLRVYFDANQCGPDGPEKPVQFQLPPTGYDQMDTDWISLYRVDIQANNLDNTDGYGYFRMYDFYVQARFPLIEGYNLTSTTEMYSDYFPYEVEPLSFETFSHTKRFPYHGIVSNLGSFHFVSNTIYIRCLGGSPTQGQGFNGQVSHQAWSPASLLKLTYKDLL
jgi:hypothetical protein